MTDAPSVEEYLSSGSKEKSGSRVDYDSLCTIGIGAVLSAPVGSITRAYALMDLQDLLAPYHDDGFLEDWDKLNQHYAKDEENGKEPKKSVIQYRKHTEPEPKENPETGPAFQREWFRLLMNQISEKGLLGRPDFSEDESL